MDVCNEIKYIILSYLDTNDIIIFMKYDNDFRYAFKKFNKMLPLATTNLSLNDLEYLKGVHTIDLTDCQQITDVGLEHLKGVHTINLSHCHQITNAGLEHLKGVHTINLYTCNKITDVGLEHLKVPIQSFCLVVTE